MRNCWFLLRMANGSVPGWNGYISIIGDKPERLTNNGYYPVVVHPITENKKEDLSLSEASNEVGQKYVMTTFDLVVCMKAYPLSNYSAGC